MIVQWPRGLKSMLVGGKRIYAPFYFRWRQMRSRCQNSRNEMYYLYGGRGITVCQEWDKDFWAYYDWCIENYVEGYSVDRVDNNGPYSPMNCRFASAQEQMKNIRITEAKRNATKKALRVLTENPHLRTKGTVRCPTTGRFL